MTLVHILHTPAYSVTPPWRTDERCPEVAGEKVWTDCCGCKVPAEHTDSSYVSYYDPPLGGIDDINDVPTGAYYGGDWRTVCHPGFGCTVKPSMRCGRFLREMWRWPA